MFILFGIEIKIKIVVSMACKTFHKGKYFIAFKRGFEDSKRDVTITIDKVFDNDSLKISLSDDEDPTFLYVLSVTRRDYDDLKKQQGLLIDFDHFPAQLVRLLQQCASNNMFLILHQTNPLQCHLDFIEHNEFKRLVHLSLKTTPAIDADIKQHMADSITNLKKTLISLKSTSSSTEIQLNDKCNNLERKVHDLNYALTKLEEDKIKREKEAQEILRQEKEKLAQERLQWQRNIEHNSKLHQAASQETLNKKDTQIEELHNLCKQLRDKIAHLEGQLSEKLQRVAVLETEVQKTHIEVATLKHKNVTLDRDFADKEKQCEKLHSRCRQLEQTIQENSNTIKDLSCSLNTARKEKTSLEERLSLSESLARKNNEAAHATSDQLMKANQIITKQNSDFLEIKEKLLCRTAIALEQEKIIECNSKELEDLKAEHVNSQQEKKKLEQEVKSLKEKLEASELALKDRDEVIKSNNTVIQWLHKKLESCEVPNTAGRHNPTVTTNSTPRFSHHPNQNFITSSDESINFYATSKLSKIEDSPLPEAVKSKNKVGLDPKYLKPAIDDNVKDISRTKSTESQSQKGKENKNIELPKVDYREKKSTRSTTYRATPVSAYFP